MIFFGATLSQNKTKVKVGRKKAFRKHSEILQDAKTVIRSDFDQETAQKIAPPIIARLDLANCTYLPAHCRVETLQSFIELFSRQGFVDRYCVCQQCIAICRDLY